MELTIKQKNNRYNYSVVNYFFVLLCLFLPFNHVNADEFSEEKFLDLVEIIAEQTDSFNENEIEHLPQDYRIIDGVLFKGDMLYKYPAKKNIQNYIIPDGTIGIYKNAFTYHEAARPCFQSLYIPESCIDLGWDANYECSEWIGPLWYITKEYIVSEDNPFFSSEDGVLYSKNKNILLLYPSENTRNFFLIPNGVKQIGAFAFDSCCFLTSVAFSDTVECIKEGAFYNCYTLESVILSKKLSMIADYAFQHCNKLENIVFYSSLRFIGYSAFQGCSNIKSISLPSSIIVIEDYAFSGNSFNTLILPASLNYIGTYAFSNDQELIVEVFEHSYAQRWCEDNELIYHVINR